MSDRSLYTSLRRKVQLLNSCDSHIYRSHKIERWHFIPSWNHHDLMWSGVRKNNVKKRKRQRYNKILCFIFFVGLSPTADFFWAEMMTRVLDHTSDLTPFLQGCVFHLTFSLHLIRFFSDPCLRSHFSFPISGHFCSAGFYVSTTFLRSPRPTLSAACFLHLAHLGFTARVTSTRTETPTLVTGIKRCISQRVLPFWQWTILLVFSDELWGGRKNGVGDWPEPRGFQSERVNRFFFPSIPFFHPFCTRPHSNTHRQTRAEFLKSALHGLRVYWPHTPKRCFIQ